MTMSPRDRRLKSEFDEMKALERSSSMLSFTATGVPATHYTVKATCGGLMRWGGKVAGVAFHEFDIDLEDGFPLLPPSVVWRTPIFHPNFKPPHVCTGDIWYPGFSLAEFCVEICNLIQYKSFNVYDPLDDEAGVWLAAMLARDEPGIPVDPRPIIDLDLAVAPRAAGAEEGDGHDGDG